MQKKKNSYKQFIVRKYIMARTAREALKIEKTVSADEVWVDEEWKKIQENSISENFGFINKNKDS